MERGLVKVRWFGVAFALFQIQSGVLPICKSAFEVSDRCEAPFVRPVGYTLAATMAAINILIHLITRRTLQPRSVSVLAVAMFTFDLLFLTAFAWNDSGNPHSTTWVVLYVAPLEGALRFGMVGSLASLAVLSAAETARDLFRDSMWNYPFQFVPQTTFRIGIMAIIALVAGMMARNLQREQREVERRADDLERLAEAETAARKEINAFHSAVLAGVSTQNFDEAMGRIVETIGETLNFDSLAMGLIEEDGRLRVVAGHRYPPDAIGRTIPLEEGISGLVARTGKPELVPDVRKHPNYLEFAPWARSEMVAPLRVGTRVIGVINAESPDPDAFDEASLEQLVRLADQVSLVVENARVLAREQQAVERLTELDTMKSDFIAITSHELRTPLTLIRGFIQTLRRPGAEFGEEAIAEYLEVIDRQSAKLHSIVEDLLFVSRLETGEIEVLPSVFDLHQVTEEAIKENFPEQIDRILVDGASIGEVRSDPDRLKRVITNVIDNALKFSPAQSPVRVVLHEVGSLVRIEVQDEGIGIADTEMNRIFDRFHQVGGSMRREQQGFGLGLYVSKKLVGALGGTIGVQSRPGRGSRFIISIPREPKSEAAQA